MLRYIYFLLIVIGTANSSFCQNINKIKNDIQSNKLLLALADIDKIISNGKQIDACELHYLKFKVLSLISSDSRLKDSIPESRASSLESFKRSLEIDRPKTISNLIADSYKPIFNLYTEGFQEGVFQYNAGRYKRAFDVFSNTATVGELIQNNGWGLNKVDTSLVFYLGLSAYRSNIIDAALNHFKKLADMRVADRPEWVTSYQFMVKYHFDQLTSNNKLKSPNSENELVKYADLGSTLYPKNEYIPMMIIRYYREKKDTLSLFKKHRELISKNPTSVNVILGYANDLFTVLHFTPNVSFDATYLNKCFVIEGLYKKILDIDPASIEVMLSLAKHYFNQSLLLDNLKDLEYKEQKAALVEKAVPLLEKVFEHHYSKKTIYQEEAKDLNSSYEMLVYYLDQKANTQLKSFYESRYKEKLKLIY